jgi:hypothetical protein
MKDSYNNLIYNNFFNNDINAYDNGENYWNISKLKNENIIGWPWTAGNWWHDYSGSDTDYYKDSLGDYPEPYNCNSNIKKGGDYEPLMKSLCYDGIEFATPGSGKIYVGPFVIEPEKPIFEEPIIIGRLEVHIKIFPAILDITNVIKIIINGEVAYDEEVESSDLKFIWGRSRARDRGYQTLEVELIGINEEETITKEISVIKLL